jgi:glycerophosphoryl diester phosphodiesterase
LLLDVLSDFGYEENTDQVFVQCFDDAEVRRLKEELHCPYKLVQLIGHNSWFEASTDYERLWSGDGIREVADYADAVGPSIPHLFELDTVDSVPVVVDLVRDVRNAALLIHPYTFRADELPPGFANFDDLVEFFVNDVGVDGLFTDFPDRVLAVLGN